VRKKDEANLTFDFATLRFMIRKKLASAIDFWSKLEALIQCKVLILDRFLLGLSILCQKGLIKYRKLKIS